MPTNYKYIDHERAAARRSIGARFTLLLAFVAIIAACVYGFYFFQTRGTDELILTGRFDEANRKLDHWTWLPLTASRTCEKLGTAKLLERGGAAALPVLQKAEALTFFRPIAIWQDVLKILWSNGRYEDGSVFVAHIEKSPAGQEAVVHYYRAGFLAGLNRLEEASRELKSAGTIPEFTKEAALLKTEIDQRAATGQSPFLFDRENLAVVNLTMEGEPVFLSESVKPVLRNSSYDLLQRFPDHRNQAVLSLDYRIQNAALKALDKYAGAIVLLDIKKGDILAAASSRKGINSEYPADAELALLQQYEPGSIIKMITLAGGIEKGVDLASIFPLQCEGNLKLSENRLLYDWKKHDAVPDMNAATAVSCNVAFAKIGLAMKPSDLLANLKQFGFNSRVAGDVLAADLGRILDGEMNDLYISNLSIGLEHLSMTPLHAAMLASAIANGGTAVTPRLLLHHRNIIGIPFDVEPAVDFGRFMSAGTAASLTRAMQDVVTHPDGTGRRAAVSGFPFAMKTGTAGEGATGYNAIMIGFGPVPNPTVAFAVVLEHAGKAEFEGARVTRLFLESIQGYIK